MEIIVINGFLGSGKTTLCQHILDYLAPYRVAVLVNEFGKIAIDDQLLKRPTITLEEIHNGSIFCSCKSSKFVEVILALLQKPFDFILIETSGFSNPDSLDRIFSFIREKSKNAFERVHSITISDPHTLLRLWKTMPVIQKQVEVADVIIVNKIDLCDDDELSFMTQCIKEVQPNAQVMYSEYANVNIEALLHIPITHKLSILQNHKNTDFSKLLIRLPKNVFSSNLHKVLQYLLPKVYRIKGMVEMDTGKYFIQIANGQLSYEESTKADQRLVVLYSSKQIGKKGILIQFEQVDGIEVV